MRIRPILLLILALLAVGAGQVRGAGPHPKLAALADNTALDLGRYTCNQPPDDPTDCDTITDYSRIVYDRFNHQLLMFGGGHAATHRTDVDVFDLETLRWTSAYPSTPCSAMRVANVGPRAEWKSSGHPIARHTYDMFLMADNVKQALLLGSTTGLGVCLERPKGQDDPYMIAGRIGVYDPVQKSWAYSPASTGGWMTYAAAEYDPPSGQVVILDYHSLWTYDPIKQTAAQQQSSRREELGYGKNLVYFPPNQKMYYFVDGGDVFEVELNRKHFSWSKIGRVKGIKGNVPKLPETGFAYDSVNRIIGGGVVNGVFHAYDPTTQTWTARTIQTPGVERPVGSVAFHALDYDPVNNVFFFISDYESGRRTWAYRYAARRDDAPSASETKPRQ
jgi:hypothetical protein